jgi:hypothetical protein
VLPDLAIRRQFDLEPASSDPVNRLARACLALAICGPSLCAPVFAEELLVITHPAIRLSPEDVRDVFLGEKQIAGGVKLHPVDNAAAQPTFLVQVMKLDPAKYSASWTKKAFRQGLNPPPVKANDAEVIEYVKRVPGAVSYVTISPGAGVNIVKVR